MAVVCAFVIFAGGLISGYWLGITQYPIPGLQP